MKALNLFFFIICTGLVLTCQKEEFPENFIPEELYGYWVYDWAGMEGQIRTSYEFQKDTETRGFSEWRWEAYMHDSLGWTVICVDKGKFSLNSNIISISIDSMGTQQYEPMSDFFYHEIHWYTRDDEEWSIYGTEGGEIAFKFEDSNLLISEDENGNGIHEESEYIKYILQD